MKRVFGVVLCLEYAASLSAAANSAAPRGVGPDFANYYKDSTTFTCISIPSRSIPIAQVNDDYCDCPDGSDEPGTAACAHLSPLSPQNIANNVANTVNTTVLPGFYCQNEGHIPSYVPFTNVNDGVCDHALCCDGSEEWEGVGGVQCPNKCGEIGKEWRKHDEARQKSAGNAARRRQELVTGASRLRLLVSNRMQTLGAEIEGAERKVKQLELELAETQRKEMGKVVRGAGGKKAGKLGVLVGLAKQRMDELRKSLVTVREERDSSKARLAELEAVMSQFKEEYNPNFNDEGVKRAVRAWEDYVAGKVSNDNAATDRDLAEIVKTDEENGLNWEEYQEDEEDESVNDVLYAFENYLPPTLRTWLDQKLRDLRITLIQNGILADSSSSTASGTESKRVTDARTRLDSAQKDLDGHRTSLKDSREDLEKDFGPDDVFRALAGTCVDTDSGEYTYEFCFMEKTTQKSKKGGAHTNMGTFVRMETITVDEELPSDGRGLGSGERIAMRHENGQGCWNGPNRRTTVVLACSERNEVWKIMEEEKCVYRMDVGTPAVCEAVAPAAGAGRGGAKDEL